MSKPNGSNLDKASEPSLLSREILSPWLFGWRKQGAKCACLVFTREREQLDADCTAKEQEKGKDGRVWTEGRPYDGHERKDVW